jgi:hypothetical protein
MLNNHTVFIKLFRSRVALIIFSATLLCNVSYAQVDTIRLMSYNVLYYGDNPACQGPHSQSHNYLKTIVSYASPDVLGIVKAEAIPMFAGDNSGSAHTGFADSILYYALNAAFPGRYNYCTLKNVSGADNISILFYDQTKLGYDGVVCNYTNITDFTTHKLYYRDPLLATTHDTVFLYITLNHTNSGSSSSDASIRASQINGYMAQIQSSFSTLPNYVNMGDFNTHNSMEACYQTLVNPSNPAYRMYDPPFSPDGSVAYPADWDNNPASYASYLTTSTRQSSSIPNSCGSSGGGKSWYDHIFLSGPIVNNLRGMRYISHSYKTLGNDGHRTGISINDAPTNTAVPATVADALFQMSNKYPVMADLAIYSLDPSGIASTIANNNLRVMSPIEHDLIFTAPSQLIGTSATISLCDMTGRLVFEQMLPSLKCDNNIPMNLRPGAYLFRCTESNGMVIAHQMVIKK